MGRRLDITGQQSHRPRPLHTSNKPQVWDTRSIKPMHLVSAPLAERAGRTCPFRPSIRRTAAIRSFILSARRT